MLNRGYGFGERRNRRIYFFLFSIFLLILLIPTVYAMMFPETVVVEPHGRESFTFNREYGCIVWVGIDSISGTSDNSINVWVTNPNGDTFLNLGRVNDGLRDFYFRTWQDGVYTVYFDNSFSSSPKTVEFAHASYMDTLLPAYYVAFAMGLILPPFMKYFFGCRWFDAILISLGITLFVTCILYFLLDKPMFGYGGAMDAIPYFSIILFVFFLGVPFSVVATFSIFKSKKQERRNR